MNTPRITTTSFAIEGDSQVYTLTRNWNARCKVEEQVGFSLAPPYKASATLIRALLYAALLPAHPLVTIQEAGELLDRAEDQVLGELLKVTQDEESNEA